MKYEVINIDIDYEKIGTAGTDFKPYMSVYIPENSKEINLERKRPTIVVCPGGGYSMTSDREAEPLAFKFLAADYNVIVVRYDVAPVRFPAQILEVAFAVSKAFCISVSAILPRSLVQSPVFLPISLATLDAVSLSTTALLIAVFITSS